MFNTKDLLERLRAGEEQSVLAEEMTNELNRLAEEYTENLRQAMKQRQFEEEQAAARAKDHEISKRKSADAVANSINLFMLQYYPQFCKGKDNAKFCTGEELIELLETCGRLVEVVEALPTILAEHPLTSPKEKELGKESYDALQAFLKEMGL